MLRYSKFIIFSLLILVPVVIASPLLYRFLPLSDGPAHFFKVWLLRYELDNYGKVFDWNPFWYGGQPLFRFYPPMSYWITAALSYILPLQLYQVFNLMIFVSYIILSFSTYYLSRILKFSKLSSLVISILIVISPALASYYSFIGAFPTIIAFSFVPLTLAFLIKSFDEKKIKYVVATSLIFSFIILLHHSTALFTILLFAVTFIFKIFPFTYDKIKLAFKYLLIIVASSLLLTSFWTIPLILEFHYLNSINRLTLDPLKILFTPVSKGCEEIYCLLSLGPAFVTFGLTGIILSFLYFNIENKNIKFKFIFEKNYILILLMFLITLLPMVLSFFGFYKIISFGESANYARFGLYLILPLALLCGIIIDKSKKYFKFLLIVLAGFFFVFSGYAHISYSRNYELLSDTSTISYSEKSRPLYDFIKNQDEGRMEIYGTFRPLASSAIPILTQKQVITGWYIEGILTYDTIINKIEDLDLGEAEFLDKTSDEEYFKILDEGFVRYILVNVCSPEGNKVNGVLSQKFNVVYTHYDCFKILENNKTYFTNPNLEWKRISPEEIVIYNVPETTLRVKESYYPHWHSYCDNKEFSMQPDKYGMITINAESCKELNLKYEYPTFYKLFYFVSLVSVITASIIIIKKSN